MVTEASVDPDEAGIAEGVGAALNRLSAVPGGGVSALAAFAVHDTYSPQDWQLVPRTTDTDSQNGHSTELRLGAGRPRRFGF